MKVGFQGINNCYSYQVIKKYLFEQTNTFGYKKFETIFEDLELDKIELAVIPIENSIGGCLFINYDLFYKYNIVINCEFQHSIEHSVYSTGNLNDIVTIISHPQALQQCKENIKKNKFIAKDYWDTAGSLEEVKKLNDKKIGCIGPPGLGKLYGLNEHIKKFNDLEKNITRFYMISKKKIDDKIRYNNILKDNMGIKDNKFSGYIIAKDQVGILNKYLNYFSDNNINLTKIESMPYLGYDRNVFSYLFFIEGFYKDNLNFNDISDFHLFGTFPILDYKKDINIDKKVKSKLKVGIIGFGRFGQFIGKEMVDYNFDVYATNRTDYSKVADKMNITFLKKEDFEKEIYDITIFATSILSFENILKSYSNEFLRNTIIVDVLSVKEYPMEVISNYMNNDYNLLLTHPMFGPDSAKYNWNNKNFVYYIDMIDDKFKDRCNIFLDFWKNKGCCMIEMTPHEHDMKTANSQFLTHFIGRLLELCECNNTNVDTDGYKSLLQIMDHTMNDSWDLFYALSKYNKKSIDTINRLKYQLDNLENKLIYPDGKKVKESETSKVYKKILSMNKDGHNIINSAIGVPTWYPNVDSFSSCYSTAKGNLDLINNLAIYYKQKYNIIIDNSNLMISMGAKPSLYLIFKYITKNSSKWVVPKPYWTSYPDMIDSIGGGTILLDSLLENNWEFSIDELENNFKSDIVNGLILCNPNNPTGICYNTHFIEKIINLCKKYNKYLIVDEVYLPLTNAMSVYFQANKLNFKKIIVVSSFSKYWAVPGWRVGWILSEENIINDLVKLQSCIFTCAPTSGMELCNDLIKKTINNNDTIDLSILDRSKNELEELFIKKGWNLIRNKHRSMYLFPVNNNINMPILIDNLLKDGLGVISGKAFGYDNAIRLTLPNSIITLNKIKLILNKNL